ncbi:MAG: NAD+ synthase [Bacteroidetes bacterium RIFOXYA12_FULL_35_11]|nr:MAG: NAD+ synthase [Bacteroidetes bacterium GWF2_35_48]OFY82902.1 MAG: NAD+ synthase [Bacteroidetes bacterium RIFOXYA12_FULL_35_11]OFY94559.1 MAG: NAD+ synthase [Bacteroidetes bacterium RIFOXYB2_FULL_35_7]OFZ01856.1 MAG: NAD+ synthase [Bacteroidetes bacterium RIFOXYC12_FULL_35_7]HBX52786.1 NAD+ synthase [Bacteroidales bacterium]
MKIALAQLNYHIGNLKENSEKIIHAIKNAEKEKADIIIFSELCVCGYIPQDLLEQKDFISRCLETVKKIAASCTHITAIVGAPSINNDNKGKKLYNSAYILADGKIQSVFHKTLLPTYDIFDEYRYFEPNSDFGLLEINNKKIAITICEDLWDEQNFDYDFAQGKLYKTSPMEKLSALNPDFIINIAASPFSYNQDDVRKNILVLNAKKYTCPIFYVNQIGAQTELIFDGGSMVINSRGTVFKQMKFFEEDIAVINSEDIEKTENENLSVNPVVEKMYDALVLGIKDYFVKSCFKQAVLGLSGGIDSALTLVLAVRALGNDNVRVLLMPSKYSSDHSVDDALQLAHKLEVRYDVINIQNSVDTTEHALFPVFMGRKADLTEENIQARIRGVLLMAVSNKFGTILLNTSNKSEAATGYGTLYGDMCGGLSVLGDVYKTDVYKMAEFINKDEEIIPWNTITKPPSAELRPDQKDSDSLPEYEVLDKILFNYIEMKKSHSEIVSIGFDEAIVRKVLRLVNSNEYKRFQAPPILRVSSKAFGFGRRMPIVARFE